MKIQGKAWVFGDDIDTDAIIPARYLNTHDERILAEHCMEDADPDFSRKINNGDIIIAGKNFGCGSSREHAPIAIKACGVSCVIAESFARIFYRNAFNMGLPILESPEAAREVKSGDILEIDLSSGKIHNKTSGKTYQASPIPAFMRELVQAGGLIPYIKSKMEESFND